VLAVAGGPIDKSWLIIRAAALRRGIDLKRETTLQYGAPPLMFQKLQQGEADAGLNFWNFCARLEPLGYRSLIDVRDAEKELGLNQPVAMIGYVFSEQFAAGHRNAINRFIEIARAANDLLRQSDGEWDALRPLIKAEDEATFSIMRERTRDGMPHRAIDEEASDARLLFRTLAKIGGPELVGPAGELDASLYYYPSAAHGE
jgi:NitT/TauT family transport system substrate-binding protein